MRGTWKPGWVIKRSCRRQAAWPALQRAIYAEGTKRLVTRCRYGRGSTPERNSFDAPCFRMASACSAEVMRPTAPVGMSASRRMRSAKGTWGKRER